MSMSCPRFISRQDAADLLGQTGVCFVDVRDLDFFMGHIPGARHHPSMCFDDAVQSIADDFAEGRKIVVFHCMNGERRAQSCAKQYQQFLNINHPDSECEVRILQGGFAGWERAFATRPDSSKFINRRARFESQSSTWVSRRLSVKTEGALPMMDQVVAAQVQTTQEQHRHPGSARTDSSLPAVHKILMVPPPAVVRRARAARSARALTEGSLPPVKEEDEEHDVSDSSRRLESSSCSSRSPENSDTEEEDGKVEKPEGRQLVPSLPVTAPPARMDRRRNVPSAKPAAAVPSAKPGSSQIAAKPVSIHSVAPAGPMLVEAKAVPAVALPSKPPMSTPVPRTAWADFTPSASSSPPKPRAEQGQSLHVPDTWSGSVTPSTSPRLGPAEISWRDALGVHEMVSVRSGRAGGWVEAVVTVGTGDYIKVHYTAGIRCCTKLLPRNSKDLRKLEPKQTPGGQTGSKETKWESQLMSSKGDFSRHSSAGSGSSVRGDVSGVHHAVSVPLAPSCNHDRNIRDTHWATISPATLCQLLGKPAAPEVIDLRPADERSAGSVTGSRWVPFPFFEEELPELAAGLGLTGRMLVFLSTDGQHTAQSAATRFLRHLETQYPRWSCEVRVLDGGYDAFQRYKDTVTTGPKRRCL